MQEKKVAPLIPSDLNKNARECAAIENKGQRHAGPEPIPATPPSRPLPSSTVNETWGVGK